MTDFEKACELANEQWVNSFDEKTDENIKFSHSHEKRIKEIAQIADGKKRIKLTRKTLKYIIIAAVLLALAATTAIATPHFKKYHVNKEQNGYVYTVPGKSKGIDKAPILKYIPNGYKKAEENTSENYASFTYRKNSNEWFSIDKSILKSTMYFNSENNDYEEFEYNGVKYTVYKSDENFYGVIWNDGTYVYDIYGSLTKSDIIKVAKCTK